MKIFKVNKSLIKFNEEMPLTEYPWKLPILIDNDYNVIVGNSLREQLPEMVMVIFANIEKAFYASFIDLEKNIVEENNALRLKTMEDELGAYIKSFYIKDEQVNLFEFTDYQCITESNYKMIECNIKPKPNKKGKKEEELDDPLAAFRIEEEV